MTAADGLCFIFQRFMQIVFFFTFWAYVCLRSYLESCWDLFRDTTSGIIAVNGTVRITTGKAKYFRQWCAHEGQAHRKVCDPQVHQVMATCHNQSLEISTNAWALELGSNYDFLPSCWRGSSDVPSACSAYEWLKSVDADAWASLYFLSVIILWCGTRACTCLIMRPCERWIFSGHRQK